MPTVRYLTWSACLFTSDAGVEVLIDPWITGDPDVGIDPSPLGVEDLAGVDLVLVTHAADDHLGQAFEIVSAGSALLGASRDVRIRAEEVGIPAARTISMMPNSPFVIDDITVIPVFARHLSTSQLGDGSWLFGSPLSFFFQFSAGPCVFFGGDTAIHGDLELYGMLYRPSVAVLGLGGIPTPGRQAVAAMSPREVHLASKLLGVSIVIPCHYPQRSNDYDDLVLACRESNVRPVRLRTGEVVDLHEILADSGRNELRPQVLLADGTSNC